MIPPTKFGAVSGSSRTPPSKSVWEPSGKLSRRAVIPVLFVLAICHVVFYCDLRAETIRVAPQSDWFNVLSGPSLRPGDVVVFSAGIYSDSRRLEVSQRGTKENPIVFRAAEGARAILKRPDQNQNTLNLMGCQYLVIQDLEITGGAAGVRIGRDENSLSKYITLQRMHIHHVGGVAVTANFPGDVYQGLRFLRNHIHHTSGHGEAFYLGSNNDSRGNTTGYVFDSIVAGNYIHDLNGPGVMQGDGIELKDGSFNNVVCDNVIHDTNYPGVLVYSADGKAPNVIERNVIWNADDHGIQAAADAIIRNNIVFGTNGDGIHCRNHQSAQVGKLQIIHNTLLSKNALRVVDPKRWSGTILVANNAFGGHLRMPDSDQVTLVGNVHDVREAYPRSGSPVIGAAVPTYQSKTDFNGSRRSTNSAGAYDFSVEVNPGKESRIAPHHASADSLSDLP